MNEARELLSQMNDRSREVFRRVVEGYLASGEPVGSRTLTRSLSEKVSAATIRNVMQDLEFLGLLDSPHVSAGLDATLGRNAGDVSGLLDAVGSALSGVTHGASLVLTPKHEAPLKHIEFVSLAQDRALVVIVFADGHVENRVFTPPPGLTPSAMREAANFTNALAEGRTLTELRKAMQAEISKRRQEIDSLAAALIDAGIAVWDGSGDSSERLIVRGRANLLEEDSAQEELDRIRSLFDDLERKRDIAEFLELTDEGEGVRIFIGSENKLFSLSGSSLVVSPYMNADRKIIGAVGVIGPTRLNYGRIVPIVDYTAQLVGRMIADRS